MSILASPQTYSKSFLKQCALNIMEGISRMDWGHRPDGEDFHRIRKDQILPYLQYKGYRPRQLPIYKVVNHLLGKDPIYGTGATSAKFCDIYIDIDIQKKLKKGSTEGAVRFAEWLKASLFPKLYYEPSNGGKGIACYLRIVKDNWMPEQVVAWVKKLQAYLQSYQHHFDIEKVEVMGQPMRITKDAGMVSDVVLGKLYRLPRQVLTRLDEWNDRAEVDVYSFDFKSFEELQPKTPEQPFMNDGSCWGRQVADPKPIENLAKYIMGKNSIKVNDDLQYTTQDLAILLQILFTCTNNLPTDGGMPTRRIKGFWDALMMAGDIDRGWQPARYTQMRNLLTSAGLIIWEDPTFHIGVEGKKGKAACYHLNEEMMEIITSINTHTSCVIGKLPTLNWQPVDRIIKPCFEQSLHSPSDGLPNEEEIHQYLITDEETANQLSQENTHTSCVIGKCEDDEASPFDHMTFKTISGWQLDKYLHDPNPTPRFDRLAGRHDCPPSQTH